MSSLPVRHAVPADSHSLASLHLACSARMSDRLENQLGASYLAAYYRVFVSESGSLVLCADSGAGQLSGLVSGVTYYAVHLETMRQKRSRLLFSALPAILRRPRLLVKLLNLQRQPWIAGLDEQIASSARITFWCWRPQALPSGGGVLLLQAWLETARLAGIRRVYGDVDENSPRVTAIHRSLGARIETQTFPDGSQQSLVLYNL